MEDLVEYRVYYKMIGYSFDCYTEPMNETKAYEQYHIVSSNKVAYDVRIVKETIRREVIKSPLLQ